MFLMSELMNELPIFKFFNPGLKVEMFCLYQPHQP